MRRIDRWLPVSNRPESAKFGRHIDRFGLGPRREVGDAGLGRQRRARHRPRHRFPVPRRRWHRRHRPIRCGEEEKWQRAGPAVPALPKPSPDGVPVYYQYWNSDQETSCRAYDRNNGHYPRRGGDRTTSAPIVPPALAHFMRDMRRERYCNSYHRYGAAVPHGGQLRTEY